MSSMAKKSKLTGKDLKRLEEARVAMLQKRCLDALPLYEKLARRNAHHVPIQAELAQCFVAAGIFDRASTLLHSLLDNSTLDSRTMLIAAKLFNTMKDRQSAASAYRKAITSGLPENEQISARTEYALVCERVNDLEQFEIQVNYLENHVPDLPSTKFVAGLLASRKKEFVTARTYLQTAVDQGFNSPLQDALAMYELASVMDKQKEYDKAFETIAQAKSIKLPGYQAAKVKSKWVARVTSQVASLASQQKFELPYCDSNNHSPSVCLLTGHPRSGTTLLEKMLDSHSTICSADESSTLLQTLFEPLVSCDSTVVPLESQLLFESVSNSNIERSRTEYFGKLKSLAGCSSDDHWLIDKNPEAIVLIPTLQRCIPNARVIVVLRDPRDVCLSCFMQFLPPNPVSVNFDSLENTVDKYTRTMNLWLTLRRKLQIPWLEIKYEELVNNPEQELKKTLAFLELEWQQDVMNYYERTKTKVVGSPSYRDVSTPVYHRSIGRWKNYASYFESIKNVLEPLVEQLGYRS